VLREAFLGQRRFSDIQQRLGISRTLLSQRLETLAEHEILPRVAYQEPGQRRRSEYKLTRKGRDLYRSSRRCGHGVRATSSTTTARP
jgi:DNA-binding HxlR family transcriptional regulator